jgi:hypothetical protein
MQKTTDYLYGETGQTRKIAGSGSTHSSIKRREKITGEHRDV